MAGERFRRWRGIARRAAVPGLLTLATVAGLSIIAGTGPAAAADPRVEAAAGHFLAGRYGEMYKALVAPARENDVDALRLLVLLRRSGHPANEHFASPWALRRYATRTGSDARLGTGWGERLRAAGDDYAAHLLRGAAPAARKLEAVRFFAARREWLHAYEAALGIFHHAGGPRADDAFGLIALSGLHDAAAPALRARIAAALKSPDPAVPFEARLASIAAFAKTHWDAHRIGIVDGLADFMVGVGGPDAMAAISGFSRDELITLLHVVETEPGRWPRQSVAAGFGRLTADERHGGMRRAARWWRAALATGRWLRPDFEEACARLCPENLRACDDALYGPVIPRGWRCLTPYAGLVADKRYRGSAAETDCLKKVFTEWQLAPFPGAAAMAPLAERFRRAQERARCLAP